MGENLTYKIVNEGSPVVKMNEESPISQINQNNNLLIYSKAGPNKESTNIVKHT